MKAKFLKPVAVNPGNKVAIKKEELVDQASFNIFKFNNRPKPTNKEQILIICCFSEFGCEVIGGMFCIPEILRKNPGKYVIIAGWYGREYLYRHLVDEFWEIKEDWMWLRDYARAFHNESKNLNSMEIALKEHGTVISSEYLGKVAIGIRCRKCDAFWGGITKAEECVRCKGTDIRQSLFADVKNRKTEAVRLPSPSFQKMEQAKNYLKGNPVGIFARDRRCYGRNLQPEFYVKLIDLLEQMGYDPIWLGEKHTTLPCPVKHIFDFSRTEEARDLELTLAIVKQLKFTVQFWTASSRLSALMGTPFILFESADQIWGAGQEGYRLNLCALGGKKLVICHYLNAFGNHAGALELATKAIKDVENHNFEDIFGLLENEMVVKNLKIANSERIGG